MRAHKTRLVDLMIRAVFFGGFGVNCLEDAAVISPINSSLLVTLEPFQGSYKGAAHHRARSCLDSRL